MQIRFKYFVGIIILTLFLIGLALPVGAAIKDLPKKALKSIELARRGRSDDPPWDPGDESAQAGSVKYDFTHFSLLLIPWEKENDFLLAKKGDTPWDPGEESDRPEVGHVQIC